MRSLALYIHIPYCDHKCIYCDFYSVVNNKNVSEYFSALEKEIELRAGQYSDGREVQTIFFGGGTPSLVRDKFIAGVLNSINKNFAVSSEPEITIEANPGTLTAEKIKNYIGFGINRLSLGVQSFFDDDLKFLTRIHDSRAAKNTVELAAETGFENINLDLIFNLPGQTKERWIKNLQTAISLPVKHISAYSLIIERGTILHKMILEGKAKIGDEDFDANLYELTQEILAKNNFGQYEVSNFACEGYECKHNLAYWRYRDYLGFGTAAHSFVQTERWKNYSSLTYYLKSSAKKENPFAASAEKLSRTERLEEYVMLALRSVGLNIDELTRLFGGSFLEKNKKMLEALANENLIERNDTEIKLTPRGYALCDEILTRFGYR